jgi:hypothetical protein
MPQLYLIELDDNGNLVKSTLIEEVGEGQELSLALPADAYGKKIGAVTYNSVKKWSPNSNYANTVAHDAAAGAKDLRQKRLNLVNRGKSIAMRKPVAAVAAATKAAPKIGLVGRVIRKTKIGAALLGTGAVAGYLGARNNSSAQPQIQQAGRVKQR